MVPIAGAHLIILPVIKDTTVIDEVLPHFIECFNCRKNSLNSGVIMKTQVLIKWLDPSYRIYSVSDLQSGICSA